MKYSSTLIPTTREIPADATLTSHILMLRAGLIRKVGSGLYSYLPAGLRALRKIEAIVRQEMNLAGASEVQMPLLIPEDLLRRSGRWEAFQRELYTLTGRGENNLALSPTNEENFTALVSSEVSSYRQFPINLYQINHKFRDEIRPRFGVMRAKEFLMKDAYSFHLQQDCLQKTYEKMREAYKRVYARLGLDIVHVKAASGTMGGRVSEEFMVRSKVGEELIIACTSCKYVANIETAQEKILESATSSPQLKEGGIHTPGEMDPKLAVNKPVKLETPEANTIEKLCTLLGCPATQTVKTMVYTATPPERIDPQNKRDLGSEKDSTVVKTSEKEATTKQKHYIVAIIRGDYDVNENKLIAVATAKLNLNSFDIVPSCEEDVVSLFGCKPGYLSPLTLGNDNSKQSMPFSVLCDNSLKGRKAMIAGANEEGFHYVGIDISRDFAQQKMHSANSVPESTFGAHDLDAHEKDSYIDFHYCDVLTAKKGGICVECGGKLDSFRGIEVGHIFQLGKRYTYAFDYKVIDKNGDSTTPAMGCYGIGISRCLAAVVETHNDKNGIIFPATVAPFQVTLILLNSNDDQVRQAADSFYSTMLDAGVEVLYDDRDERPGVKFQDADLLGSVIQIIFSKRNLINNQVEIKERKNAERSNCPIDQALNHVKEKLSSRESLT